LKVDRTEVNEIMKMIDTQGTSGASGPDGRVSLEEFKAACNLWSSSSKETTPDKLKRMFSQYIERERTIGGHTRPAVGRHGSLQEKLLENEEKKEEELAPQEGEVEKPEAKGEEKAQPDEKSSSGGDEEDEDEEEEEEYWHLTDNELKLKAMSILLFATGIVAVFSDPMVDVINNLGGKMKISPFYVSFVVTPLASNASEVISGVIFARKKTTQAVSLCFASLLGAACMNNTLALCIFMALVYFRELSWDFSAEIVSLVITVTAVGIIALHKNIFIWQAIILCCLYPLCLILVASMEAGGLK